MKFDGDIYNAFKPLYIFSKCFLLYPFSLSREENLIRLKIKKRDYLIIIVQILFIIPSFSIAPNMFDLIYLQFTVTDEVVFYLQGICCLINNIATVKFLLMNKSTVSVIFNQVYDLEKVFLKLRITKSYKKMYLFSYLLILYTFFFVFTGLLGQFEGLSNLYFAEIIRILLSICIIASPKCILYFFIYNATHNFALLNNRLIHIFEEYSIETG